MRPSIVFTAVAALAFLNACSSEPELAPAKDEAADFAARINGVEQAASNANSATGTRPVPALSTGRVASSGEASGIEPPPAGFETGDPVANAARGVFTPGTFTDPASETCGANQMGPFIGREASRAVRDQIEGVIGERNEVRFILAGSGFVTPDASSPRLNIMLDRQDVIRDARCG